MGGMSPNRSLAERLADAQNAQVLSGQRLMV